MEPETTPAPAPEGPLLTGSIEQYVIADVPTCRATDTAADIRAGLALRAYESVDEVVVSGQDHQLLGLIPIARLLASPADARASDLMDEDPPVIHPGFNEEQAAWKAVRHGESSLAVVDATGTFRGLVPPTRLIAVPLVGPAG